jgi:hypothetical protein
VQLIEVSLTGVRSAVITLRRPETPLQFVLFPMLHLGTASFYEEVGQRLGGCQLVVAEGVGRTLIVRALTIAYRLPGRRRRLGLVVQRADLIEGGAQVIRPDMTAAQFRQGWRAVPALHRIMIICLAPVVGLALWLCGTRRMLSRYATVEDQPDVMASLLRDQLPELTVLLEDDRDRLLASALDAIHAEHQSDPMVVAVLYGAGHMPAVAHYLLDQYGYRPREAEWLNVFDF